MYLPPAFREDRLDVLHELIRAHPLGLLVSAGPAGLVANPLPFMLYADDGQNGTLRAHFSRANPHWRELAGVDECLVVFQGAQDYITPSWYPTKRETGKVVPTWNYVTVHVWGAPRLVDDGDWLRRQLDDLTRSQEASRPAPWQVSDAPESYVAAQMRGIIGIEIPIGRLEGKWIVSQNRSEAERRGVAAGLLGEGGTSQAMARLVAERGAGS